MAPVSVEDASATGSAERPEISLCDQARGIEAVFGLTQIGLSSALAGRHAITAAEPVVPRTVRHGDWCQDALAPVEHALRQSRPVGAEIVHVQPDVAQAISR